MWGSTWRWRGVFGRALEKGFAQTIALEDGLYRGSWQGEVHAVAGTNLELGKHGGICSDMSNPDILYLVSWVLSPRRPGNEYLHSTCQRGHHTGWVSDANIVLQRRIKVTRIRKEAEGCLYRLDNSDLPTGLRMEKNTSAFASSRLRSSKEAAGNLSPNSQRWCIPCQRHRTGCFGIASRASWRGWRTLMTDCEPSSSVETTAHGLITVI